MSTKFSTDKQLATAGLQNKEFLPLSMISYLAIGFILLLLATVFYGFSMMMRRPPTDEELTTEVCTLCRNRFDKKGLVERELGDYKVLYFCGNCIRNLEEESAGKTKDIQRR